MILPLYNITMDLKEEKTPFSHVTELQEFF